MGLSGFEPASIAYEAIASTENASGPCLAERAGLEPATMGIEAPSAIQLRQRPYMFYKSSLAIFDAIALSNLPGNASDRDLMASPTELNMIFCRAAVNSSAVICLGR